MTTSPDGRAPEPEPNGDVSWLRLLPWDTPDHKTSLLSTSDGQGVVSRYADDVEDALMAIGADALAEAEELLADREACPRRLQIALQRTAKALSEVLRVAESRGVRLSPPGPEDAPLEESGKRALRL